MFNLRPVGKYLIQVCGTTPCYLRGANELISACKKHLNIELGETTQDKMFTLTEVECLGACVNAPVVQVNDNYYEDLNEELLVKLLDDLAQGKEVKVGSQINRHCSAPCDYLDEDQGGN
jgi:NADH:ubiquinone oxidoreductase subunit E